MILYIFLALIFLGMALSIDISFPEIGNYAYSLAIFIHSIVLLYIFIKDLTTPEPKKSES